MRYTVSSELYDSETETEVDSGFVKILNGPQIEIEIDRRKPTVLYARLNGSRVPLVTRIAANNTLQLSLRGYTYDVEVRNERDQYLQTLLRQTAVANAGSTSIKSPMPGLIKQVQVEDGQRVKKGERLFVLEAMKMENDIKAPQAGLISAVSTSEGEAVEKNHLLCIIKAAE